MTEHSSMSAEETIRATLQAVAEPLLLIDQMGRIDFANLTFQSQFSSPSDQDSLASIFSIDASSFPFTGQTRLSVAPYELIVSPVAETSLFIVSVKSLDIKQLLDSTLDIALLVTDASFRITDHNETANLLFGYEQGELVGMCPHGLHDQEEFDQRKQHLEQLNLKNLSTADILLLHGREAENEWTYHRKDGSTFNGRLYMTRLDDGRFFLFIADISSQKQIETHLIKSERRFRLFSESIVEAVIFHDHGKIIDANRAAEVIFRTKLEQIKGRDALNFIHPDFHDEVSRRIELHRDDPYEVIGRRADGSPVAIEVFPREIVTEETPIRVAVIRDISERKKIEVMLEREKNAIMRQRDITQSILQASNEGFLLTEEDGSFIFMNVKARKLLDVPGIAPSKIQERISMIPNLDLTTRYEMLQQVEELLAGKHSELSFRFTLQRPNESSHLYFEFYATSIKKERSRISRHGFLFVFRDRTEEQKMDQVKDELISTVSHELRTPLSSILGYMELLRYRKLPAEKVARYVEIMHEEAKRLTTLLNEFLDIQRMEGGKQPYDFKPFSLRQLLVDTAEAFGETAETHQIILETPDDPVTIFADENKVKQVILNLLSNAIKYSPSADRINASLKTQGDQAIITVTDYGLGIPQNAFDKLFTKFYRVDNSAIRKIGGTGLGLAICKEIIESHGGAISVESELNQGSTFTVVLDLDSRKDYAK
ncbi:ATP-binding protein [Exiguobacterium sp. s193]|uniref:PAS domain-containing sensor histidine kinase n=1 Tax=Exiguobacterium sp. s193 TaxID=2751207 RepID=UPI001BE81E04|nr:ATP-binding protein [Exiguobacterium sp. s193]